MPRQRQPTISPSRVPARRRAPLKLSAREARETAKKAQVLKRFGLYAPRIDISSKAKFTPRQEKDIARRFARAQSHAVRVPGKAKPQRLFKRSRRGYVLTDAFRTDKRKINAPNLGVIKTHKGSIVPRKAGRLRIENGTVVSRREFLGEDRTVKSGTLNPKQTIKFLNDVVEERFKIPEETLINVFIFDSSARGFVLDKALREYVAKYQLTLLNSAEKNLAPLTLEYIKI